MTIGERLKKIRTDLGLSQEKFAEKLNCKRSDITDIERNIKFPRLEILENLYMTFSVNMHWFLFNVGDKLLNDKNVSSVDDGFKIKYYESLEKIVELRERLEKHESLKSKTEQTTKSQ